MAASSLRPDGDQWRKRTGPHQTGSGHVSSPDPRLGPAQGPVHVLSWDLVVHGSDPAQGVRGPPQGSEHTHEGSGPRSKVRSIRTGVRHFPMGSGPTVVTLEYTFFSGLVAT